MATIKGNKSPKMIKKEKDTKIRYALYPILSFNPMNSSIDSYNKSRMIFKVFKVEFITDTTKGEYTSIVKMDNGNNVTLPTSQIYSYKKDADRECEYLNRVNQEMLGRLVYEMQDKMKKLSEILNPNRF